MKRKPSLGANEARRLFAGLRNPFTLHRAKTQPNKKRLANKRACRNGGQGIGGEW